MSCLNLARDHCILWQALNTLSLSHFWCICQQRILFLFIIQTIQLWHLLANSLFYIDKQKNCHCYKKHLKWGNEVMKRVFPIILYSMAWPMHMFNQSWKLWTFCCCCTIKYLLSKCSTYFSSFSSNQHELTAEIGEFEIFIQRLQFWRV